MELIETGPELCSFSVVVVIVVVAVTAMAKPNILRSCKQHYRSRQEQQPLWATRELRAVRADIKSVAASTITAACSSSTGKWTAFKTVDTCKSERTTIDESRGASYHGLASGERCRHLRHGLGADARGVSSRRS